MIGIGSSNDALLQQRGKVIAIEMDAAANADGLIGPSASSSKILSATDGSLADQVVAAAILYESRFSHIKQCIIKSIDYVNATMSISSDPSPPCLRLRLLPPGAEGTRRHERTPVHEGAEAAFKPHQQNRREKVADERHTSKRQPTPYLPCLQRLANTVSNPAARHPCEIDACEHGA